MKNMRAAFLRDLGVVVLLLWAFAQALVMTLADPSARLTYLLLIIIMDAIVLSGFTGRIALCTVLSSTLTCVWVSYKLYCYYANGEMILSLDYVLAPLPLVGALACSLFRQGLHGIDSENTMLRRQVEDLVLVDDVTGLYNLRALYRDLRSQVHYSARNNLPVSLMLVQPRYEAELRGMLPKRQYLELRQIMANIVSDGVRVEDKAYCIDDVGTLGIILTTTEGDSQFVRNRLKDALQKPNAFEGILERGTKLDVRFACKQYDRERYGEDMMAFKNAVESELVYDV